MQLFMYAVLYAPTKVGKEKGEETILLVPPTPLLSKHNDQARLEIARLLPSDTDMSRVEILVRPF